MGQLEEHLNFFDDLMMNSHTQNQAIDDVYNNVWNNDKFDRVSEGKVKHYDILKKANIPLYIEKKPGYDKKKGDDDDFMKFYCDTNLRMHIKEKGMDKGSILSKNSQNSLKSDISVTVCNQGIGLEPRC